MKKTLLITSTHGDEKIGQEIVSRLKHKKLEKYFDVLVANPRARSVNKRFVETDLNRSYPGNPRSPFYEERVAARNLLLAQKYSYVIDLHEASAGRDDFIIIPRQKISSQFPLQNLNLKTVLLWPDPPGPLGQVLPQAVELEFGMKNRNRRLVLKKATKIVTAFLEKTVGQKFPAIIYQRKNFFYVYGKISTDAIDSTRKKLTDFQKTAIGKEGFYPLLVNQYRDLGIWCYKMRRK